MPTDEETIIGFDYGTRKIGVAVGSSLTSRATPLCIVKVTKQKPNWDEVERIVTDWNPDRFVVGLSMHADNTESPVSIATRRFATLLEKKFRRPTAFVNEYLSSYAATFDDSKHELDALAAKVILETWFAENTERKRSKNE